MTGYRHRSDAWTARAGERLVFALIEGFEIATRRVPLWPLEGACAWLAGWLALALPGVRRRAEANFDLVRPDLDRAGRRRLLRAAAGHFTRLCVEYTHFERFIREARIDPVGLEHLTEAAARGKGVVLVTAHYGNWEACRLTARRAGIESGIIYRAFNNRFIESHAREAIRPGGEPVMQKGAPGMRRLMAHVSRGGVAMILVDQRNTGAPLIPFLGVPAETVTIAAELCRRTGAALIPAVGRRDVARRRFEARFEAPVTGETPEAMMAEVNRRIGAWIEADPEQWFWFHRRWKRVARRSDAG